MYQQSGNAIGVNIVKNVGPSVVTALICRPLYNGAAKATNNVWTLPQPCVAIVSFICVHCVNVASGLSEHCTIINYKVVTMLYQHWYPMLKCNQSSTLEQQCHNIVPIVPMLAPDIEILPNYNLVATLPQSCANIGAKLWIIHRSQWKKMWQNQILDQ